MNIYLLNLLMLLPLDQSKEYYYFKKIDTALWLAKIDIRVTKTNNHKNKDGSTLK